MLTCNLFQHTCFSYLKSTFFILSYQLHCCWLDDPHRFPGPTHSTGGRGVDVMTMTMAGGVGGGIRNLEHIYIYTFSVESQTSHRVLMWLLKVRSLINKGWGRKSRVITLMLLMATRSWGTGSWNPVICRVFWDTSKRWLFGISEPSTVFHQSFTGGERFFSWWCNCRHLSL